MLHNLEGEERARIPEVSVKLVEPFRRVVEVAMARVRSGIVGDLNRQTVKLWDDDNSRLYIITDVSVEGLWGVVISTGYKNSGLLIKAYQLDKVDRAENPLDKLLDTQLPRDPDQVNKETLYWHRGSEPNNVEMLAVVLSSARKL